MIVKENEVVKQIDENIEENKQKISMLYKEIEEKDKEIDAIKKLNSISNTNETKAKKLTQAQKALLKEQLNISQPSEQQKESIPEAIFMVDKLEKLKKQLIEEFTKYIDALNLPLTKEEKMTKKAEEMKIQAKPVELDVEIEDDTASFIDSEIDKMAEEGFFEDRQKEEDRELDEIISSQEKQSKEDYEQEYGREEEEEYDVEEEEDYGEEGEKEEESESFF